MDFTKDIHVALYFALEHYCQKVNAEHRKQGLVIYCFPCIDADYPKTGDDNKSPFITKGLQPDMNLAIGGQMKLESMKLHMTRFDELYCRANQKQAFGWDRAYHPNPRLSFQEGMLAYPYRIDGVTIEQVMPSWFVQCLRMNPSDPFHLGSAKKGLKPLMIQIPEKTVTHLLQFVQDVCGFTPSKIYLDYGKVGDHLEIEPS